jgi:hypothetical protein
MLPWKSLNETLRHADLLEKAISQSLEIQRLADATKLVEASVMATSIGLSSVQLMEDQQKRIREAAGPLDILRRASEMQLQFADVLGPSRIFETWKQDLIQRQQETARLLSASINSVSETATRIAQQMSSAQANRLAELAAPFQAIRHVETRFDLSDTLRSALAGIEVGRKAWLPLIDASSALAIAQVWGKEGAEDQLHWLDLNLRTTPDTGEAQEADRVDGKPIVRFQSPDIWTVLSIILVILTVIYQKLDAEQTEARLTAEIKTESDKASAQTQALAELLRQTLDRKITTPQQEAVYIVKDRVARIRDAPRPGSRVLAEVVPNQVVTRVGQRGKWIEVQYFDWLAQDYRQGWALKKYFILVPTTTTR